MAAFPWGVKLPKLDNQSPDEYISANAAGLTDLVISNTLSKVSGKKVSSDMVSRRRGRVLQIPKTGGPNTTLVKQVVSQSPFARYDSPPQMESDRVVVLPDLQAPFQNSDFLNRVLDLCDVWNIKHSILAGDVLENATLTHFDPAWLPEENIDTSGIPNKVVDDLLDVLSTLPKAQQNKLKQVIEKHGRADNKTASSIGQEWHHARMVIRELVNAFEKNLWILGNHTGRFLRQMQSPLLPSDVKRLFVGDDPRVDIAPYYYAIVKSGGETWRVIHPKSSGRGDAQWYASKYLQNIVMCHSHHWMMAKDRSGKFFAIESGCIVDEDRLAYVGQRDTKMHRHLLGATIIRDGKPWLLGENSDWDALKKMR